MTIDNETPETTVPAGEEPPARCPVCDRPFRTDRLRWLHLGEVHGEACTDDQTTSYESAREAERDDLFYYQLKVAIALGLVYSSTALLMMVLLG